MADAWPYAANDVVVVREAMAGVLFTRHREDGPDVHGFAMAVGAVRPADMLNAIRQHAKHAKHPARQPDGLADYVAVAIEPAFPQTVAQHDDVFLAFELVIEHELPAERGSVPEQGEETGRYLHATQVLGLLVVAELKVGTVVGRKALERLQLSAIVAEVGRRHREMERGQRPSKSRTSRFGLVIRKRRGKMPRTALKMAVLAPMTSASVVSAAVVKPGRPSKKPDGIADVLKKCRHRSLDEAGTRIVGRRGLADRRGAALRESILPGSSATDRALYPRPWLPLRFDRKSGLFCGGFRGAAHPWLTSASDCRRARSTS